MGSQPRQPSSRREGVGMRRRDKDEFMRLFRAAFPQQGEQIELALSPPDNEDEQ